MDGQLSFATLDYAGKKKRTKRAANGGWCIDPAEFHRTFPPLVMAGAGQPPQQQDATPMPWLRSCASSLPTCGSNVTTGRPSLRTGSAKHRAAAAPATGPATSGNLGNPACNRACNNGNRLKRTWRWLRSTG